MEKSSPRRGKVFDPSQLLELSKLNPAARIKLLSLIGNVVERGPVQLREARLAWNAGRIEDSARLLHTMRGTIGTLGATRFAEAALQLESAIGARHSELVPGLFVAAQQEMDQTVAAASALLLQEAQPDVGRDPGRAKSAPPQATSNAASGTQSGSDWFHTIRGDIRSLLNEVRKLKDDVNRPPEGPLAGPVASESLFCLIVEDDELIAHLLVHLLMREGYRVQRCADGREARKAIEQAGEAPALILLDVMLPYADGFELIRLIREQRHWGDVPIIMLTAKQQESDIVRALDAGATDYVVKPFQPNELMARLRRILRKKG